MASIRSVQIQESIHIRRPCETVWDYTQDFARRTQWDAAIVHVEDIQESPHRRVRVVGRGFRCTFEYKAAERPLHTSVIMKDVTSPLVTGGGGSWRYEPQDEGCLWTQTMRIELGRSWVVALCRPWLGWMLRRQVRTSMQKARTILETQPV